MFILMPISPTIDFSPWGNLLLHELLEEFAVFGAGVARTPRGVGTVILLLYGSSNRFFNSKFTGNALTPRGVRAFENSSALHVTPRGVSATPQVNRPTGYAENILTHTIKRVGRGCGGGVEKPPRRRYFTKSGTFFTESRGVEGSGLVKVNFTLRSRGEGGLVGGLGGEGGVRGGFRRGG